MCPYVHQLKGQHPLVAVLSQQAEVHLCTQEPRQDCSPVPSEVTDNPTLGQGLVRNGCHRMQAAGHLPAFSWLA